LSAADELSVKERGEAVRFGVRVQPRSSREGVIGVMDGSLRVALTAPPVDGEANAALVAFLAKKLGVSRRDVVIVQGETGRSKVIEVRGVAAAVVRALVPR
jgi:uncharacterized protein (TIGR00251 family)